MANIECDGCEERCSNKPVVVYPAQEDKPGRAFIVCDERDGMGRIRVSFDRMRQWQATGELIAAVLARLLVLSQPSKQAVDGRHWPIGTLKGKKHNSPMTLQAGDSFTVSLAGHLVPLVDVLTIEKNALALDKAVLIRMVDNPTGNSETETPEARRERIRALVQEEKAKRTKAFLRVVAEKEGISISRLKQIITGKPESEPAPAPANPWLNILPSTKQTSSKKTNTKY